METKWRMEGFVRRYLKSPVKHFDRVVSTIYLHHYMAEFLSKFPTYSMVLTPIREENNGKSNPT